jgi:hypothetical protein
VNLNYAEVPLQICYFDRRRSHFGAGLSISRLVSVKEEGEASTPGFPPTDFSQYPFKKMDYNFIHWREPAPDKGAISECEISVFPGACA